MTENISLHGAVSLAHWGVIRAKGADAASFLHGQLTNDTEHLGSSDVRLAGYCSAKGRLLATFLMWKGEPDEIFLACSSDLLQATLKRLSMFVLRAKCKLTDASGEVALHGLVGAPAELGIEASAPAQAWHRASSGAVSILRLPDAQGLQRFVHVAAAGSEAALPAGTLTLEQWRWLEVMSGIPMISKATSELFVPQMINLELVGGVNFQKGCYPGQEIVARAQYRGAVKRRAFVFNVDGHAEPGQDVYAESDPSQPAGTVAMAASAPRGGSSALVELKLSAWDTTVLHLGAIDGPVLAAAAQPYALPLERAVSEH